MPENDPNTLPFPLSMAWLAFVMFGGMATLGVVGGAAVGLAKACKWAWSRSAKDDATRWQRSFVGLGLLTTALGFLALWQYEQERQDRREAAIVYEQFKGFLADIEAIDDSVVEISPDHSVVSISSTAHAAIRQKNIATLESMPIPRTRIDLSLHWYSAGVRGEMYAALVKADLLEFYKCDLAMGQTKTKGLADQCVGPLDNYIAKSGELVAFLEGIELSLKAKLP